MEIHSPLKHPWVPDTTVRLMVMVKMRTAPFGGIAAKLLSGRIRSPGSHHFRQALRSTLTSPSCGLKPRSHRWPFHLKYLKSQTLSTVTTSGRAWILQGVYRGLLFSCHIRFIYPSAAEAVSPRARGIYMDLVSTAGNLIPSHCHFSHTITHLFLLCRSFFCMTILLLPILVSFWAQEREETMG